jgi:hypothetical protein
MNWKVSEGSSHNQWHSQEQVSGMTETKEKKNWWHNLYFNF